MGIYEILTVWILIGVAVYSFVYFCIIVTSGADIAERAAKFSTYFTGVTLWPFVVCLMIVSEIEHRAFIRKIEALEGKQ